MLNFLSFRTTYNKVWSAVWLTAWAVWAVGVFFTPDWLAWFACGMWAFCIGMTFGRTLSR